MQCNKYPIRANKLSRSLTRLCCCCFLKILMLSFQANWYKAEQYCRFHGMHLASINSAEEQKDLQDHIQAYGKCQNP